MSRYSDTSLSLCLDNYFLLFEGILPGDAGCSNINHSPFESCALLKADVDRGLAILTPDNRWADVLVAMNALYADGFDPSQVFYDNKHYFKILSKYQKAIVKYHFKIYGKDGWYDEDESRTARQARIMMLHYLNERITPTEWKLVNKLVKCLL